jgi:ubiquitin-protein ligase
MNRCNYELFSHNSYKFKIIEPSSNNSYFIVLSADEKEYEWLDKINKYCVINNIGKDEIKKKIEKYLEKHGEKKKIVDKELDHYSLKAKLQNLIQSSVSPLIAERSAKSLFNKETVAGIIINEYMNCSKWMMDDKNVNLTLLGGNIFVWNFCLSQFKNININCDLTRLKSKFSGIEIEICFHGEFYPNYPPVIKIINPRLKKSLSHRISNSKMTQLDYWTPTRSTKYIIERIIKILETYGEIDVESSLNSNGSNKAIIELENYLIKFASFTDSIIEDDEIDSGENFIKFTSVLKEKVESNNTIKQKSTEHWKKGTGYGHHGAMDWNINEYVKSQQDKDEKLANIIQNITKTIHQINNTSDDFVAITEILEKSLLIPYLRQQFKNATPLEIHKKENLFRLYLSLLESITTEKSIYLFDENKELNKELNKESLYSILGERKNEFEKALSFDKDNEIAMYFVNIFNNLISPIYKEYIEKKAKNIPSNLIIKQDDQNYQHNQQLDVKLEYKKNLTELRFDTSSILETNYRDEYKKQFNSEKGNNWKLCQKRLASELTSLMPTNQLPIEYDSSIFVRVDDDNPMIIRALITGPPDTPYDSGCLIFDIYAPSEYPNKAPFFWFMNHGGKRFNPNLYNCGKVCLSILGTYSGPNPTQSEKWNPNTSTLLQVLISIQAQILIDEPYFNEPGYESLIGTDRGKINSKTYNADIRLYTMKSTVRDLLQNPKIYGQFEDIIKEHFRLKKDYILKTYEKWCLEAPVNMKKEYDEVYKDIKKSLD